MTSKINYFKKTFSRVLSCQLAIQQALSRSRSYTGLTDHRPLTTHNFDKLVLITSLTDKCTTTMLVSLPVYMKNVGQGLVDQWKDLICL